MVTWILAQAGPGRAPGAGRAGEAVTYSLTHDPVHWIAIVLALFLLGLWHDRNTIHLKQRERDGD